MMLTKPNLITIKQFLKKNKKKLLLLMLVVEVVGVLSFTLSPSTSQQNWIDHYPETKTFIPFEYREGIAQFQFIKLEPNLVIGGGVATLDIRIWEHKQDDVYKAVDIRIDQGDYPYTIQFDEGYGFTDHIYSRFLPDNRHDFQVKVKADCNGCRNHSGFVIGLYDLNGNLLQEESVMIRMYDYETLIEEWYWELFQ